MRNAIPPFWNQGQAMKLQMRAALGTHTAFLPDNYLGRNSFSLFLSILWPDLSWVLFYKLNKIQQELNLPLDLNRVLVREYVAMRKSCVFEVIQA